MGRTSGAKNRTTREIRREAQCQIDKANLKDQITSLKQQLKNKGS